ncbi:MAG: ACT domain-containing protein [Actinomycetota bacterium]
MSCEIVVSIQDRPGTLAQLAETLGRAGVDIRTAAVTTRSGKGQVHVVVDDPDTALKALREAKAKVQECREVLLVSLDDEPGALASYARQLADAGVNIRSLYMAGERPGEKHLIIGVDDVAGARRAVGGQPA